MNGTELLSEIVLIGIGTLNGNVRTCVSVIGAIQAI